MTGSGRLGGHALAGRRGRCPRRPVGGGDPARRRRRGGAALALLGALRAQRADRDRGLRPAGPGPRPGAAHRVRRLHALLVPRRRVGHHGRRGAAQRPAVPHAGAGAVRVAAAGRGDDRPRGGARRDAAVRRGARWSRTPCGTASSRSRGRHGARDRRRGRAPTAWSRSPTTAPGMGPEASRAASQVDARHGGIAEVTRRLQAAFGSSLRPARRLPARERHLGAGARPGPRPRPVRAGGRLLVS